MKRWMWSGLAAAAVLFAGAAGSQGQSFKFDLADEYPANSVTGEAEAYFVAQATKLSGGRIQITPHFGGSLGYKSADHNAAVRDGAVGMASTPLDKLSVISPIFNFQNVPFISPTVDDVRALYDATLPWYRKGLDGSNQLVLFSVPWTSVGVWSKKRIDRPEDMKGVKLRTFEVIGARTFQRAGAAPVQMSWADVVPALTTGTIEAVLTSDEGGANAKFWDVGAKFFNAFGYSQGVSVITMNKAEFAKLPADMQKALIDAAADAEKHAWSAIRERTDKNKKMINDAGGTFVDNVPTAVIEHLRQAATPELDAWKASVGAAADDILAAYAKAKAKS